MAQDGTSKTDTHIYAHTCRREFGCNRSSPVPSCAAVPEFSGWLLSQVGRDDPIGDLAADVRRDPPAGLWGASELRSHMRNRGACCDAVAALDAAIAECGVALSPSLI